MGIQNQTFAVLYKAWEDMKAAHDQLDRSKQNLAKAERNVETAMFMVEESFPNDNNAA